MDYALDIELADEKIVERMSGRRVCVQLRYNHTIIVNIPPKKEGICDSCGGELQFRADDQPETVLKRLGVYHEQTQPLIEYYAKQGILKEIDGTLSVEDGFASIVAILGE